MADDVSTLERTLLGLVALDQPCTAYHIRQRFIQSPSPRWSGSAGAIYPALSRLTERGLLAAREDSENPRRARWLRITSRGRKALKDALLAPVTRRDVMDYDPLRARVRALGALPASSRVEALAHSSEELDDALTDAKNFLRDVMDEAADPYRVLAALGGLRAAAARRRWLDDVMMVAQRQAQARDGWAWVHDAAIGALNEMGHSQSGIHEAPVEKTSSS